MSSRACVSGRTPGGCRDGSPLRGGRPRWAGEGELCDLIFETDFNHSSARRCAEKEQRSRGVGSHTPGVGSHPQVGEGTGYHCEEVALGGLGRG